MNWGPDFRGIPIFIGYDKLESGAFWVTAHSIIKNSSQPVHITPLRLSQLPLTRPKHKKQSNEFAFTRWLVPYLCGYYGHAIFMDCDFLCRGDIAELWYLRDNEKAVQVCKHPWKGEEGTKFLDRPQTKYNRKCWSSLILFNNYKCKDKLRPEDIDRTDGLHLHQFEWLRDDQIGEIPLEWNWLVDVYPHDERAKMVHFTRGGPYFNEYKDCDYSVEWRNMQADMLHVQQSDTIHWADEIAQKIYNNDAVPVEPSRRLHDSLTNKDTH